MSWLDVSGLSTAAPAAPNEARAGAAVGNPRSVPAIALQEFEFGPALSDTEHDRQVAAGERGTRTRGLRTSRPQHSMFTALLSSPRVRLGSSTNTQGMPSCRPPILPSQNSSTAGPFDYQPDFAGGMS